MAEFTIPGGDDKGKPLSAADTKTIQYWLKRKKDALASDPNHKFAVGDKAWIAGAEAFLAQRAGGGSQPTQASTAMTAQPASQSIVMPTVETGGLVGAFGDPRAITTALMSAQQHYHVATPAMSVGGIPEGCEIYTSLVIVDPYGPEVYPITGNRDNPQDDDSVGLDKNAIMKIAAALGISWLSSKRTDNASHPHYCAWEAWGAYQQFDGQVCKVPGNVDIDVRAPDGAAYTEIVEKAARANRGQGRDPGPQLLELRKFLIRHCETKAMTKVVGNVGVRRSYKRKELKKPFLVARLAVTGRTDDPQLRREFARMHYQQRLAGTAALYGGAAPALLPEAHPAPTHEYYESSAYEPAAPVTYSLPMQQQSSQPVAQTQKSTRQDEEHDPDQQDEQPAAKTGSASTTVPADPKGPAAAAPATTKPNYAEGEADL